MSNSLILHPLKFQELQLCEYYWVILISSVQVTDTYQAD